MYLELLILPCFREEPHQMVMIEGYMFTTHRIPILRGHMPVRMENVQSLLWMGMHLECAILFTFVGSVV